MSTATQSNAAPAAVVAAVEQVVGSATRPVQLHEPYFPGNEKKYVGSCIDDRWVSSAGPFVDRFEREIAAFCGAKHAVAVVNGTCALQVALSVLGVQPGDEVIVPSLTFVATANAVCHVGAIPHFVDAEENSLGIDPVALEKHLLENAVMRNGKCLSKLTGHMISAIVPVHIFGHPCQLDALHAIAKKYNLILVEDATEALGSLSGGKKIGSEHTSVFSFNGNKIITTGGGGAIVTNDDAVYKKLRHVSSTARVPHAWALEHDEVAWNYRMPNLNAALGCAQLEKLPDFVTAKRGLAQRYVDAFAGIEGGRILTEPKNTSSNYWLVSLLADRADAAWLQATLKALHDAKLLCRPLWTPLHQLSMYRSNPKAGLPVTESLANRLISLPSSVALGVNHG